MNAAAAAVVLDAAKTAEVAEALRGSGAADATLTRSEPKRAKSAKRAITTKIFKNEELS